MAKKKKRAKRKTKRAGKTRGRKKKTTRRRRSAEGVNKSQAIRDYLAANPQAGPTGTVAALASKGIKVTTSLVSGVKTRSGSSKKRGRGRGRPRKTTTRRRRAMSNDTVAISDLLQAKKLAERMGGIERAQTALAALARLSE